MTSRDQNSSSVLQSSPKSRADKLFRLLVGGSIFGFLLASLSFLNPFLPNPGLYIFLLCNFGCLFVFFFKKIKKEKMFMYQYVFFVASLIIVPTGIFGLIFVTLHTYKY